jgi:hypothetical protein
MWSYAMNEFATILLALGRGIIKILISALVGFGVALLVIGISTSNRPEVWNRQGPPGELLMGIGAGLLSGGGTLLALFFLPWFIRRRAEPMFGEEAPMARPAPRSMRYGADDVVPTRPVPKPVPRHEAEESAPPVARPAPTPEPRDEPGSSSFYER